MYRHFAAIAEAVDIPIVLYNIPGRAWSRFRVETMARLAKHRQHHRREGRDGQSGAAQPRAARLRQGLAVDLGRGRHRAGLHGAWRAWLHLGDRQCGAEAVRRVPGRLHAGRLRHGARTSGPADAAARRDVLRGEPGAGEICRLAAGPVHGAKCACRMVAARPKRARAQVREAMAVRRHLKSDGQEERRRRKIVADNRKARYAYAIDDAGGGDHAAWARR